LTGALTVTPDLIRGLFSLYRLEEGGCRIKSGMTWKVEPLL
jgi:hypothetical protein